MSLNTNTLSSICKYLPIEDIVKLHAITKFNLNLQIFKERKYFKIPDIKYLSKISKTLPVKFFIGRRWEDGLIDNDDIIAKLMEIGKTLFVIYNINEHIYGYHNNNIWEDIITDKIQGCDIIILYKTNIFRLHYNINHKCMNEDNKRPCRRYRMNPKKDWLYIRDNINNGELNIIFEFTYHGDFTQMGKISFQYGFLIIGNSLKRSEPRQAVHCRNYIKIDENKEFVQDFVNVMIDIIESKKILDTLNNANYQV
jgi:hypothetical protein